jgi:hypothetical protein
MESILSEVEAVVSQAERECAIESHAATLAERIKTLFAHFRQVADDVVGDARLLYDMEEFPGKVAMVKDVRHANTQTVQLRRALKGLIERLDEVHNDPYYRAVWTVAQMHHGKYEGLTYTEQLDMARSVLALTEETAGN